MLRATLVRGTVACALLTDIVTSVIPMITIMPLAALVVVIVVLVSAVLIAVVTLASMAGVATASTNVVPRPNNKRLHADRNLILTPTTSPNPSPSPECNNSFMIA